MTNQLRWLVDRGGLSLVTVADRTEYSRSSWERYLDGRLLPPLDAVRALAVLTGADMRRLEPMWQQADHVWREGGPLRLPDPGNGAAAPPGTPPGHGHPARAQEGARGARGRRRALAAVLGVCGVAAAASVAALLLDLPPQTHQAPSLASPPPPPPAEPGLPPGVRCQGDHCTGKDPETMGCGGQRVASVASVKIGDALVEVRYSEACRAAWARITGGGQGDRVRISAGGHTQRDTASADGGYTPMVAVASADEARACGTLTTGAEDCTEGGGGEGSAAARDGAAGDGEE